MGFLMLGRGLGMSAAMDWRSYSILRLRDSSVAWLRFLSCWRDSSDLELWLVEWVRLVLWVLTLLLCW